MLLDRSNQDIVNQAVLEVSDRLLYDIENHRAPFRHGPLDPRLVSQTRSTSPLAFYGLY
jgi:DNA-directed RNA polymerase III subunit RPC1